MTDHVRRNAFTLVELLIVIAVIAMVSVVAILVLNPQELIKRARDANRLSDIATINSALAFYNEQANGSLGAPSTVYISVPDPAATSTAGDQCQGLGLPALAAGWSYACAATSTYKKTNGTGWIPLAMASLAGGSPFSTTPVDPTDATSSGLFYTYTTNGTQYAATSLFESAKQKMNLAQSPVTKAYPDLDAAGTDPALAGLFNSTRLLSYWNFEEGSGATAVDQVGSANGTWAGTPTGDDSTYYADSQTYFHAGKFNGTNDIVSFPDAQFPTGNASFTIAFWIYPTGTGQGTPFWYGKPSSGMAAVVFYNASTKTASFYQGQFNLFNTGNNSVPLNQWSHIAITFDGASVRSYINGVASAAASSTLNLQQNATGTIGSDANFVLPFAGLLDDVRFYTKALSPAEVWALNVLQH